MLYLLVAVTIIAGWTGAPWWGAVAGSCLIALVLFREDMQVAPPPGDEALWDLAETLTNVLVAAAAGGLAFLTGRLASLLL